MSIRLRFTLLYNAILAVTLAIFGLSLYSIQAQVTLDALHSDLVHSAESLGGSIQKLTNPLAGPPEPRPVPFANLSHEQVFRQLSEREIVRVLDSTGTLVASPFGSSDEALPLSEAGLAAVQNGQEWWETATYQDQSMLIYSRPVVDAGSVTYILQIARPLTERNRSLQSLAAILVTASLLTILLATVVGWVLSEVTLRPIHRLTQTAQAIGKERDFSRRVSYAGPQDEVGQLATTFNAMLSRLQEAYQKVAHALEMQRNFVADVSHELRTPLTTLRGNLDLLHRTPPIPTEEREDILVDMTEESERLIRLVNDLLVLARADAGRGLAKEPVAILPVLEETCRQARVLANNRAISLEAADFTLTGDRDAFKQVILIALDNALKHSTGDVFVRAAVDGAWGEISIADEGEGIPPERLEHIFERFYRGSDLYAEDGLHIPGFGLGLPIARALVEGMGGEIAMHSEVGKGSRLAMRFRV